MTGYVSPPSDGRDGDIHLEFLEQELVTVLNDFANTSPTPHFDAPGIRRHTRRRRAGFVAAVAAVVVAAGVGSALAAAGSGSHTARPAAQTTTSTTPTTSTEKGDVTTVPYVKPFDLKGVPLAAAEKALAGARLKVGTVTHGVVDNCKPGSVIAVSPLAPTVLHGGETVDLAVCG
ncbi:hypothetical protein OH768_22785 [Streptomyces sp. NBC_01622]|uniref:hypothetical protein n=1 Tax=Streptomyces sp. NBC_01622 TaxID=2975903 RepID=UPI003864F31D|nr:hypothetical protein OH768_22785 [Streptomyces sp. NBC_01622]